MKYTAINIGPIGATFAIARKPREFWLASYMFSHLMKCLIKSFSTEAKLISPYLPESESHRVGLFPDRAFFKSEHDIDREKLIEKALIQFAVDINKNISFVHDYFNIMSLSIDDSSCPNVIEYLNTHFNYMELCNHTNTSKSSEDILAFLTEKYNSPLFEIAFGDKKFEIDSLEDIAACELKNGQNIKLKSYHNYICIVQADGDSMGKVISHISDDNISDISKKLITFGSNASELIAQFGGLPIYAGGDDLLFIAPVWGKDSTSIFSLINRIDTKYKAIVQTVDNLPLDTPTHTSMSYGVSITYNKYPLYEAWRIAGNLLFDEAKHLKKKNAIAWQLQKHSGSTHKGKISKSNTELYDAFTHILYTLSTDTLFSSVAHKIRANEILLGLWKETSINNIKIRLKAFFDKIIDTEDKDNCVYLSQVQELLIQLYKILQEEETEDKPSKEVNDISELISATYGMLRTAKFINGEEKTAYE